MSFLKFGQSILRIDRRFTEYRNFLFGSAAFSVFSHSPSGCRRSAARIAVLDATVIHTAKRRTRLAIDRVFSLFAELSERVLDQLDRRRGIEDFLFVEVEVLDPVLSAVGQRQLILIHVDA